MAGFLLVVGFLWSCLSTAQLSVLVTRVTSDSLETVSKQEVFTHEQVTDLLIAQGKDFRHRLPYVFPPALLMLISGLILAVPLQKRTAVEKGVNPQVDNID